MNTLSTLSECFVRPRLSGNRELLVSTRVAGIASLRAFLETHALLHPRFRVDIVRHQNVVSDDRLYPPALGRQRPTLLVVLEGQMRAEHEGIARTLGPGDVLLMQSGDGLLARREGPRFSSLLLDWTPGSLGGARPGAAEVGSLPAADRARLRVLFDGFAWKRHEAPEVRSSLGTLIGLLRGAGAPLLPFEAIELGAEVTPTEVFVSRALDQSLSDLGRQPMIVDLERALGVSARHVQRLVADFHARYGCGAEGWRDALNRRRLVVGATLMTAPGATCGLVAAAVGYGSLAAFRRAFAESNLPSPGRMAGAARSASSAVLRAYRGGSAQDRADAHGEAAAHDA